MDRALDWVPGYLAVHTAYNASRGYRVETSEIALAVIDGVTTATFVGKLAGQTIKTVGRQAAKAEIQAVAREVTGQAARQFAANERREGAKSLLTRLPGVLSTVTRSLPKQMPTLNVTSVVRSSSAVAKKVGVRTWGKLDRRIIMRGDRMVVIDLFNPQVISQVGEEVRDTAFDKMKDAVIDVIQWKIVSKGVGELSPCIMERVLPKMRSEPDEPLHPSAYGPHPPVADTAPPGSVASYPSDHPAFTPLGSALIVVFLALAIPRVRGALARRIVPGLRRSPNRPRRYEE